MIVFLHPADEFYGADRVALALVERLRTVDDVQVWLPTDVAYPQAALSGPLRDQGVQVRFLDLPVLRRMHANVRGAATTTVRMRALRRALRHARPRSVYVNTSALAPAVPVCRSLGIPADVHVHEAFGRSERLTLGPLLDGARRIIVVSESVRRGLPRHQRRRAEVIRHTITDPVRAQDREGSAALRASIGLTPRDTAVLVASRWSPAKGVPVLLDAIDRIERADVHLVIAGGMPPAGQGVDIAAMAGRSVRADHVHVVGELADMRPWFAAADAVAVPSVFPDPYPTIALEGVAAGLPVLASDIGGLPEIVDSETGRLIRAGDPAAWAQALRELPERSEAGT